MSLVIPSTIRKAMLTALTAMGGELNGVKMGLYVSNTTPGPATILTDLTEATWTGYAQSGAITWGGVAINGAGDAEIVGPREQFLSTGVTSPAQINYGYFIVDGAGTTLIFAERFDTPVTISVAAQYINVVPKFVLSNPQS